MAGDPRGFGYEKITGPQFSATMANLSARSLHCRAFISLRLQNRHTPGKAATPGEHWLVQYTGLQYVDVYGRNPTGAIQFVGRASRNGWLRPG